MENISQEQFLAFGAIGLAIIGFALLVSFALMAGTLKLSIAWLGKASPSFLACLGWLLAISFVNCFIVFGTMTVFGETAVLLVTPLTWFVSLYMISTAAHCGLIRAFAISLVHSLMSSIGLVAIMFVATIPLAILGAGANAGGDNLQAEFDNTDAMMTEPDGQLAEFDELDLLQATEVSFQAESDDETSTKPERAESQRGNGAVAPVLDEEFVDVDRESVSLQSEPTLQQQPSAKSKRPAGQPVMQTRRAADGSTINPFFQD